tara:strand:+ start:5612 stop:6937 length:1326 start_codon:yes stop_codon:yes gene_type:complete
LNKPIDNRKELRKYLDLSSSDFLSFKVSSSLFNLTRIANNSVTQNLSRNYKTLTVTSWRGKKTGYSTTTDFSSEGIKKCISNAEFISSVSPENEETMPPVSSSVDFSEDNFDTTTAYMSADKRVSVISPTALKAEKRKMKLAGTVSSGWNSETILNTEGLDVFYKESKGGFSGTLTNPGGGTFRVASESCWNLPNLSPEKVFETLFSNICTGKADEKNPKKFRVLLLPEAVGSLLAWLLAQNDLRSAEEGRSAFSENGFKRNADGRICSSGINISMDPNHPDLRTPPFDHEGHPLKKRVFIKDGFLNQLTCSRYWAKKKNIESTGFCWNMIFNHEKQCLDMDSLIKTVGEGLFVPRFWYNRYVDPMQMLITGLTRDGLRSIENGVLGKRVKNFRFNDSPLRVLNNIVAVGKPELVSHWGVRMLVPPMVVDGFNMTSVAPGE